MPEGNGVVKPEEDEGKCTACQEKDINRLCPKCIADIKASTMHIQEDTVVLVRVPHQPTPDMVHAFGKQFSKFGKRVHVLFVPVGMNVESLDSEAMKKAGWIRAHGKIILPPGVTPTPKE